MSDEGPSDAGADGFTARYLQLGYVAGAHGVRGALRVKLFNPESTTLEPGVTVALRERGQLKYTSAEVTRVTPKPGADTIRLGLVGVDGRDAAEGLRGHELWIERARLPELDDEEYYLVDLIGLDVVRELAGVEGRHALGKIVGVATNSAQDLLRVRPGRRGSEWLLPALPPFIVAVEIDRGYVLVDVHDDMISSSAGGKNEPKS